ncbi:MAG: hypothetical protein IT337_05345 [Thermomicrobiales bacterium]|nr:hypothetical protein [Thermomicrobiales bacterium]
MTTDASNLIVLLLVIGARLLVPLAIPRYPLPASIAALVIDGVDKSILQAYTTLSLDAYQSYDKALDIYYLSIQYLTMLRLWVNLDAFRMGRLLYYFRMVGVLFFELLQARPLLLLFPNTFEYFFLFYEGVRVRWNPRRMGVPLVIGAAFVIWVAIKIPQEYWIHIAQLDATDAIKEHLFGVPVDMRWLEIARERTGIVVAVVLAVVAAIVIARRAIATLCPPFDWPPRFAAAADEREVSPEAANVERRAGANRLFDTALFEKFALVALVTTIFSRILPNVSITVGQTVFGVALVVIVNTAVSHELVRRGVLWSSALVEFVVMAAVNGATAVLFFALRPIGAGSIDRPALLFSLLLLTLLVTMFDRFSPYYRVRVAREDRSAPRSAAAAVAD